MSQPQLKQRGVFAVRIEGFQFRTTGTPDSQGRVRQGPADSFAAGVWRPEVEVEAKDEADALRIALACLGRPPQVRVIEPPIYADANPQVNS